MKRVIIVHGWGGFPEEGWFPWLKKELEAKDFIVEAPQLPDTDNPRIEKWVPKLAEVAGTPDENTYFVGHSMGCQTIARYLETLPEDVKIGGAIFVAGFFTLLTGIEPEEKKIEKHWMETPIDLKKVKLHLIKSVALFSDDDSYVPLDNQDDFRTKLGSEIIVQHKMNHFLGSKGITELPIVLEKILEMAK